MKHYALSVVLILLVAPGLSQGADWTQFRGPGGLGVSHEQGIPVKWSSGENIAWQTKLPGPGSSSPIALGNRVFLTCYSGYGLKANEGGGFACCQDAADCKLYFVNTRRKRHLRCSAQSSRRTSCHWLDVGIGRDRLRSAERGASAITSYVELNR